MLALAYGYRAAKLAFASKPYTFRTDRMWLGLIVLIPASALLAAAIASFCRRGQHRSINPTDTLGAAGSKDNWTDFAGGVVVPGSIISTTEPLGASTTFAMPSCHSLRID